MSQSLSDRIPYVAAPDRPALRLPGGAKLAVWVIVNAGEFLIRGRAQAQRLRDEAAALGVPRVMAISIHPHFTGAPHRIGALEALLDAVAGIEGVVWMTASQIGDWYRAEMDRLSGHQDE